MTLTLEDRILTKLDKLDGDLAAVHAKLAALDVHMSTQHDRILNLEQTTRKTVWYVFGIAGTTIAAVAASVILSVTGVL